MQNPEMCRGQAMKCMLLAREAEDFPYKLLLLSIAQLWRAVADSSDQVAQLGGRALDRAAA
jgi:hypothetical protein